MWLVPRKGILEMELMMSRPGLLVVLAVLGACRAPKPPAFAGGVELPLAESWRGTVFVPVVIDGHTLRFVLDTGATITAVTPALAETLGLVPNGNTLVNGTIEAKLATVAKLEVGSIHHDRVRVAIVDLPEAKRIDEPFDGVLGLDVLSQHDVAIDIPRRRVVFFPPRQLAHADDVNDRMIRVDFKKSRLGLIEVTVDFDERGSVHGYLDLGAQRTFTNPVTGHWIEGPGNGDPERAARGLRVGNVRWERFSVIVEELPIFSRWIHEDELGVVLGADLFGDRAIVLAYQEGALFVAR